MYLIIHRSIQRQICASTDAQALIKANNEGEEKRLLSFIHRQRRGIDSYSLSLSSLPKTIGFPSKWESKHARTQSDHWQYQMTRVSIHKQFHNERPLEQKKTEGNTTVLFCFSRSLSLSKTTDGRTRCMSLVNDYNANMFNRLDWSWHLLLSLSLSPPTSLARNARASTNKIA